MTFETDSKVEIGDVGQQPQRRPGQVEQHRAAEAKMRRAGFLGHHPPRIKNTIAPARNVGERARRRLPSVLRNLRSLSMTP
jgi:hypothetical protein